jgi:hypothetical protein
MLLALGSTLLLGCSKNPESTGKELASLMCDCATQKSKLLYERNEQLQKDIEGGKYKTQSEVYAEMKKFNKEIRQADSTCSAKPNSLTMQAKVDFVKEEERTTLANAFQANYQQCVQEEQAKLKDRKPININALLYKLPYSQPATQ